MNLEIPPMRRFAAVALAAGALLTTTALAAPAEATPAGTHYWKYPGGLSGTQAWGSFQRSHWGSKATVLFRFNVKDAASDKRDACIQAKFWSGSSWEQYTFINYHGAGTTASGGQHSYYRGHLDIRECVGYYYKSGSKKKFKVTKVSSFRRYY
ncbi:MAG: hypothetical protein JWL58_7104 [Streptosporangiaceae bacterium]|jgi:hypothetical protein|nr:hypothetical protein [Streptosporangiaceae bacterium]